MEREVRLAPVKVIEPSGKWGSLKLAELLEARELIWILAWRDIAVRYKQTLVGAAWAIVQPLSMVLIFSIIFRRWAHMPSQGVPYPLYAFAGVLPWQYFSTAMIASSGSLLRSSAILTKVYFPRLVFPIAGVLPPLVDFALSFATLILLLLVAGIMPNVRWLLLPFLVTLLVLLSLAIGIFVSAISVEYRDISQLLPFATQLWMFASPIMYPPDLVGGRWRWVYTLNPMVGIIDGFRWILLGTSSTVNCNILIATAVTFLLLIVAIVHFKRVERVFADLI